MHPVTQTQIGTGTTDPVVLDFRLNNGIAFRVDTSGTVNYTVQHTFDDVFNVAASAVVWQNCDDTSMVAATTTTDSAYVVTPFANRLVVNSGAGTAKLIDIPQGRRG